MYDYWQDALVNESIREQERARRRVRRRKQREKKILKLQRDFQEKEESDFIHQRGSLPIEMASMGTGGSPKPRRKAALNIFNRIGLKKTSLDLEHMSLHGNNFADKHDMGDTKMHRSSSTPNFLFFNENTSKLESPPKNNP